MAGITIIKLEKFDLDKALNGHSLALSRNGSTIDEVILNFQRTTASGFTGVDESGAVYFFDREGNCSKPDAGSLKLITASIGKTSGTTGDRVNSSGTGNEKISIDTMQPREQFAMAAMQGILGKMPFSILEADNGMITLIASKAFMIAQEMINTAADYRAATQSSTPPEEINIDANTITSVSDKILFNISQSVKKQKLNMEELIESLNTLNTDLKGKIDTTNNKLSSINNSIVSGNNGTQKVSITNTASVNVANTPNVTVTNPVESVSVNNTVSVDGTVSVDNFPSTQSVSGTVHVDNMLTEPVYVSIRNNSVPVTVENTPLSVSVQK